MTPRLEAILDAVQHDPGRRGLRADARDNLVTATAGDFAAACDVVASAARVAVVTGFTIPSATPPCGETDGPLGALYLARSLTSLGIEFVLATDGTTLPALRAAVAAAALHLPVVELADAERPHDAKAYAAEFIARAGRFDVLIALERVGPARLCDRCYSMRGRDMTDLTRPAHLLFETGDWATIGIGDGGNEIGMGKIPWDTIRKNVRDGDRVACRVPTDHVIVAGVSNWGAYALAAGVRLVRGAAYQPHLFDATWERHLLNAMIDAGPLIDGVSLERAATVDGLAFDAYVRPLTHIGQIVSAQP
jgi:hypothetical protein